MQGWLKNSRNPLYKVVLFSVFWFFAIIYRNKIYGRNRIPKGSAILAANHTSFYDPPLLSISTPYEVYFLARKTLFDVPLFGRLIHRLNARPVSGKAQDVSVFKAMVKLMKEGKKMIIFPEGKRSVNGQLQPLKPGIALLISRSQAAVVPAYLHGTFNIWPPKKKLPKLFGKTACVFGQPLYFAPDVPQEEIARKIEESILALKAWYDAGAKGPLP
jgi:1-acyl-sn-glycerol-3-phosphate acyltransferase